MTLESSAWRSTTDTCLTAATSCSEPALSRRCGATPADPGQGRACCDSQLNLPGVRRSTEFANLNTV